MAHVFIESNWVFGYAAPGHHKLPDAVELLQRARSGEIMLHLPAPCLSEARQAISTKCQPRNEADAVRKFLLRAKHEGIVSRAQDQIAREVLDRFEQSVHAELRRLDEVIDSLREEPGLEIFSLNEKMLDRAIRLSMSDLWLKPFDQAVLASVLVRAEELRNEGETDFCFCETDADLQPWDKGGSPKKPLAQMYDDVSVWVYDNFALYDPDRPDDWPE